MERLSTRHRGHKAGRRFFSPLREPNAKKERKDVAPGSHSAGALFADNNPVWRRLPTRKFGWCHRPLTNPCPKRRWNQADLR